ncbi:MAG: hypothetical protein GTO30_10630, partial [Acidobacteria bacterium]|nr:hypothetical protein [Acidobacteriota bacterium]
TNKTTKPALLVGVLAGFAMWVLIASSASAQMTCIECHADPGSGGFHGGFRGLSDLTDDEVDVVCISCHDGSYTNASGVLAPEAAV